MQPFEVACCLELKNDSLVYNYLMPIAQHELVSRLWIIRSKPCGYANIPKAEYLLARRRLKVLRWPEMLGQCRRIACRPEIRAFVSFNPLPYGLIGAWAAWRHKKAVHFGFIGSDWYRDSRGPFGSLVRKLVHRGDFFTATGTGMARDMIDHGITSERVATLPHCVDLQRYVPHEPAEETYACIFVGQLIERKRVDLILCSFAEVLRTHPREKLCILGSGPCRQKLIEMARNLGIAGSVDFAGQTAAVQDFLSHARINIIASDREGLPFSVIEGMCCGAVPVCTPAGTLTDLIKHEQTGLLFPHNDAQALAGCICRLLDDGQLYGRLRTNILELRPQFSFERATAVWNGWFAALEA